MLYSIFLVISLFYSDPFQESKGTPIQIGNFTLPNIVSGNNFSLSEFNDSKAIVVIFTSNYCPYAKLYNDRVNSLIQRYKSKGVSFVLINSNDPTKSNADNLNNMSEKAAELETKIPYLIDSDQEVADMFGAHKTPEVFLLTPSSSNQYKIAYKGAIDDNPQVASDVNHHFLQEAIEDILRGSRPEQLSVHPTGCMIKR